MGSSGILYSGNGSIRKEIPLLPNYFRLRKMPGQSAELVQAKGIWQKNNMKVLPERVGYYDETIAKT
jgi:hypothetical protein